MLRGREYINNLPTQWRKIKEHIASATSVMIDIKIISRFSSCSEEGANLFSDFTVFQKLSWYLLQNRIQFSHILLFMHFQLFIPNWLAFESQITSKWRNASLKRICFLSFIQNITENVIFSLISRCRIGCWGPTFLQTPVAQLLKAKCDGLPLITWHSVLDKFHT